MAKKLELLKEVAPQISRVGVLWNPSSPSEHLQFRDLMSEATAAGVAIQSIEARAPDDLPAALADAISRRVQALMVVGNPITFKGRHLIADFTRRNQLPSVFEEQLFVEAGGLMSYGPSFEDLFRRAAIYVDRIFKGAKPAELPVEQPIRFNLAINRKTATSLGLTFPSSVLLRADRVMTNWVMRKARVANCSLSTAQRELIILCGQAAIRRHPVQLPPLQQPVEVAAEFPLFQCVVDSGAGLDAGGPTRRCRVFAGPERNLQIREVHACKHDCGRRTRIRLHGRNAAHAAQRRCHCS